MAVLRRVCCVIQIVCVFLPSSYAYRPWMTTDELENHISPEDLQEFLSRYNNGTDAGEFVSTVKPAQTVDCFGLGSSLKAIMDYLLNMKPVPLDKNITRFFFSSRQHPQRVEVFLGDQFGLEWVDFKPNRKSVLIVHGFMSHSDAAWVHDMTKAFLQWDDLNVIAVDWSAGGNTWKYWRAVANTRRVGSDIKNFLLQLQSATGCDFRKDFHFIGHSLGAHICSFASHFLGGVARITGLDPAQPCFRSANLTERLDASDADFVDVIHTNGRLLRNIGFGWPEPTGHADFYPNGGMRQPGCKGSIAGTFSSLVAKLEQSICSHGRSYFLFTESLVNSNCTFMSQRWDLTYDGVNNSLGTPCDRSASCAEMGINSVHSHGGRPSGTYFLITTDKEPFCPTQPMLPKSDLLRDLREGFRLDGGTEPSENTTNRAEESRSNEGKDAKKRKWWQVWRVG